jgi:carbonyl reductase 1
MIFPSGSDKKALMESAATDLTIDGLVALSKEFVESVKNGTNVEEGWPKTCYGASKCAIIALTKIISRIEPSVVINSCCPGYCATDMTSHRGTKSAAEGAKTPVMLANFLPGGPTGRFFSECREVEW